MNKNKYKTKDTEYGEGYGNGYEKGVNEQRQEIINEIAQYSGINDIQTKELIKIIKEL